MIGTKYTITERNKIQRKKRINRQKKQSKHSEGNHLMYWDTCKTNME